jgi:hypothetical protein
MRHLKKPSPAMFVACLSLFVALSGVTYAATGGNFILGQANTATSQTGLTSNNAGKALNITQQNTGVGATALGLSVPSGKPAFTVNSGTKVANLNADKLDGFDSTQLVQGKGKTYTLAVAIPRNTDGTPNRYFPSPTVSPGFFNVGIDCPPTNDSISGPTIWWKDLSGTEENLFLRNDNWSNAQNWLINPSDPKYGDTIGYSTDPYGDLTTATIQGAFGGTQNVASMQISTVKRASDCHFQIQALTTKQ